MSTGTSIASFSSLPPELLSIIFLYVHDDYKLLWKALGLDLLCPPSTRETDVEDSEDNVFKPHLQVANAHRHLVRLFRQRAVFPYSFSKVCTQWKDILSSYPSFWTHIVLFIDDLPTTSEEAMNFFKWSGELPIDIWITRRKDYKAGNTYSPAQERHLVTQAIEALKPHLRRCLGVHIDTTSTQSLPVLTTIFTVEAPFLQHLSLQADIDRGQEQLPVSAATPLPASPCLPACGKMIIDGRNFALECGNGLRWIRGSLVNLRHLTITKYGHDNDEVDSHPPLLSVTQLLDAVAHLPNLVSLKLDKLGLGGFGSDVVDTDHIPYNIRPTLPHVEEIYLEELKPHVLTALFRYGRFPSLHAMHIIECWIPEESSILDLDHQPIFLSISEMLLQIIEDWVGRILSINKVFLAIDPFLALLATSKEPEYDYEDDTEGGLIFPCLYMHTLWINHCTLNDIASLKALVEARNHYVDYEDPLWRTRTTFGPAIKAISVTADDGDTLAKEDEDWFKNRLCEFEWTMEGE